MTKKVLFAAFIFIATATSVSAQELNEARKVEIAFPQIGFLRSGGETSVSSGIDFAVTLTDRVAAVGEFRGSFDAHEVVVDSTATTYRGGLRYREPRGSRATLFAQGTIGGVSNYTVIRGSGVTTTIDEGSGLSLAVGGGVDIGLKRWLAVRVLEASYEMARVRGSTLNGFRMNWGIVFRIGSR